MQEFLLCLTDSMINNGHAVTYAEAEKIMSIDEKDESTLTVLFKSANQLRKHFAGDQVDLCTILNVKSGACTEDCQFCVQSAHYKTDAQVYALLPYAKILVRAQKVAAQGAYRFSLVTSGRGIESDEEFKKILAIYRRLSQETNLQLCASLGIINKDQAIQLKEAGVTTYHHNVETARDYYKQIVSTHDYCDRVNTIKEVALSGLNICSGGILGLGESNRDRINMAFELKNLNVKSIPLNVLMPLKGTPLADQKVLAPLEILKTMALFRFIIPDGAIRYAGGRIALKDKQALGFKAGVNAALVGDFLTTSGSNISEDKKMIDQAGLKISHRCPEDQAFF